MACVVPRTAALSHNDRVSSATSASPSTHVSVKRPNVVVIGIIVYCVGMALFTVIMGNAFAAITVMTVGIGAPFVLAYGADPTVVGMVALTAGYCGTLMTPMAANFNIVPVAILEMKDKYGVIKNQAVPAIIMLVVQIFYMIAFS